MINRNVRSRSRPDPEGEAASRREPVWAVDQHGRGTWLPADPRDPLENPFHTFTEWDSEADHRAYDKL